MDQGVEINGVDLYIADEEIIFTHSSRREWVASTYEYQTLKTCNVEKIKKNIISSHNTMLTNNPISKISYHSLITENYDSLSFYQVTNENASDALDFMKRLSLCDKAFSRCNIDIPIFDTKDVLINHLINHNISTSRAVWMISVTTKYYFLKNPNTTYGLFSKSQSKEWTESVMSCLIMLFSKPIDLYQYESIPNYINVIHDHFNFINFQLFIPFLSNIVQRYIERQSIFIKVLYPILFNFKNNIVKHQTCCFGILQKCSEQLVKILDTGFADSTIYYEKLLLFIIDIALTSPSYLLRVFSDSCDSNEKLHTKLISPIHSLQLPLTNIFNIVSSKTSTPRFKLYRYTVSQLDGFIKKYNEKLEHQFVTDSLISAETSKIMIYYFVWMNKYVLNKCSQNESNIYYELTHNIPVITQINISTLDLIFDTIVFTNQYFNKLIDCYIKYLKELNECKTFVSESFAKLLVDTVEAYCRKHYDREDILINISLFLTHLQQESVFDLSFFLSYITNSCLFKNPQKNNNKTYYTGIEIIIRNLCVSQTPELIEILKVLEASPNLHQKNYNILFKKTEEEFKKYIQNWGTDDEKYFKGPINLEIFDFYNLKNIIIQKFDFLNISQIYYIFKNTFDFFWGQRTISSQSISEPLGQVRILAKFSLVFYYYLNIHFSKSHSEMFFSFLLNVLEQNINNFNHFPIIIHLFIYLSIKMDKCELVYKMINYKHVSILNFDTNSYQLYNFTKYLKTYYFKESKPKNILTDHIIIVTFPISIKDYFANKTRFNQKDFDIFLNTLQCFRIKYNSETLFTHIMRELFALDKTSSSIPFYYIFTAINFFMEKDDNYYPIFHRIFVHNICSFIVTPQNDSVSNEIVNSCLKYSIEFGCINFYHFVEDVIQKCSTHVPISKMSRSLIIMVVESTLSMTAQFTTDFYYGISLFEQVWLNMPNSLFIQFALKIFNIQYHPSSHMSINPSEISTCFFDNLTVIKKWITIIFIEKDFLTIEENISSDAIIPFLRILPFSSSWSSNSIIGFEMGKLIKTLNSNNIQFHSFILKTIFILSDNMNNYIQTFILNLKQHLKVLVKYMLDIKLQLDDHSIVEYKDSYISHCLNYVSKLICLLPKKCKDFIIEHLRKELWAFSPDIPELEIEYDAYILTILTLLSQEVGDEYSLLVIDALFNQLSDLSSEKIVDTISTSLKIEKWTNIRLNSLYLLREDLISDKSRYRRCLCLLHQMFHHFNFIRAKDTEIRTTIEILIQILLSLVNNSFIYLSEVLPIKQMGSCMFCSYPDYKEETLTQPACANNCFILDDKDGNQHFVTPIEEDYFFLQDESI